MNLETIQKITLDFTVPKIKNVRCVENDSQSRTINILITDNGNAYPLEQTTMTANCKIHKPDHTFIYNKVTINDDGTVTIILSDQAMVVPGILHSELQILKNGNIISTMPFNIIVEKSVLSNKDIVSANESDVINSMITHLTDEQNPHKTTKEQVGLGNADNTSDMDKPISTAQQAALDEKVDKTTVATASTLGLVKSGTDITVDDNGNVSVNDNSHNHTVSNISDLSEFTQTAISDHNTTVTAHNDIRELITALTTAVENKVDKVSGKGLSTNDYTTEEKDKLSRIASGAEVNVQADWDITDSESDAYIKNKPVIPTKTSQLVNDSGFTDSYTHPDIDTTSKPSGLYKIATDENGHVTNATSVSKEDITALGIPAQDTDTWRGIQDNLTSTSTSDSLSANQGRVLKGLVDGKADSNHNHASSYVSKSGDTMTGYLIAPAVKFPLNNTSNFNAVELRGTGPANNQALGLYSSNGKFVTLCTADGGANWPGTINAANLTIANRQVLYSYPGNEPRACNYINTNAANTSGIYYITVNGQWGISGNAVSHNIVSASSDIRLKENIKDTESEAIPIIMQIKMRQFDWKHNHFHQELGFIADEIEKINPNLAFGGGYDEDGSINVKTVNEFYLQGYVVKAIQEQQEEINELKKENAELSNQLNLIKDQITHILQNQEINITEKAVK